MKEKTFDRVVIVIFILVILLGIYLQLPLPLTAMIVVMILIGVLIINTKRKTRKKKEEVNEEQKRREKEGIKIFARVFATKKGYEAREEIQEINKLIVEAISKKYNLKVSEDEIPIIMIMKNHPSRASYSPAGNYIALRNELDINDGTPMGEEIGHFLRRKFRSDAKEILTGEFFGWMGRRIWFETSKKDHLFFPKGEPNLVEGGHGNKIQGMMQVRENIKKAEKMIESEKDGEKIDKLKKVKERLKEARKDFLTHHRGYEAASRVDLNKIKNWEKLFSMPDQEIRHRFFGREEKDMDYSGLG